MPIDPGPVRNTIIVTAESDPFGADPPYAPAFYEAMGRIVVLWGRFEVFLDAHQLMVINIARRFGLERGVLVALRRKTRQICEIYKACPVLESDTQTISQLMSEIDGVAEDRNLMIHSLVDGFIDSDPPRLNLRIIEHKKGNVTFKRLAPSLRELGALAGHIDRLHNRLLPLFLRALPLQEGYETVGTGPPPTPRQAG